MICLNISLVFSTQYIIVNCSMVLDLNICQLKHVVLSACIFF